MKQRPLWLKWIFCLIPAVLAALMYFVLPYFPEFTEYVMVRGVFRAVAFPVEWLVAFVPFSLTEAVVVLCVPAILTLIGVWIFRMIKRGHTKKTFERGIRFAAWCVSLALLIFMVMDGAAFSRIDAATLLELPDRKYNTQQLYAVTCELASKASSAREKLNEDKNGITVLSVSKRELLKLADDCYKSINKEYPFLKVSTHRVKPVMLSHYWSYTGFTGVYCPWIGEASVNVDVPDYELGHTAAHEIAHTMGFAKENECNFLSFLACVSSGQPDYVYSGYQQTFVYFSNALYKADRNLWKKAYANCSEGLIRDLRHSNEYWKAFEGEVQQASQDFNDSFIKVNGVESGVLSYNKMVELTLRYYDKQGFFE